MSPKVQILKRSGSVLILAIWVMSLLSFFAVYIGLNIRQKASLLSRIEKRSELRFLSSSGIKSAVAALHSDLQRGNAQYTPYGKYFRHNNAEKFKSLTLGRGSVSLQYEYLDDAAFNPEIRYGFVDEESKININLADRGIIKRLIQYVVTADNDRAQELTDAIVDWREFGQSRAEGFYSESYYSTLKEPYEPKNAPFEVLEELRLLKGMDQTVYDRLTPFITVYGDGLVNINTAPRVVLLSLGLNEDLVDKILLVRRGFDGVEATIDDFIFLKIFDIAVEMKAFVKMSLTEMRIIDDLNAKRLIKTNSFFYRIKAVARLSNGNQQLAATCVYNIINGRLQYWREK